ncbi:MAG: ParB/RepB/Spo0J family partition protein [Lawsonibacter sp.]|nr:ParB/RepB/Spo0J family partition protein [Lawsonibacter sp.]
MGLFSKRTQAETLKLQYEGGRVLLLPVEEILPNPHQPRVLFAPGELEELADSIRALGILQPLTVRRGELGWELVAGERRLRAARLAGLERVPCLAVQTDGQSSSLLALVENLQRKDLDFWEEALALRKLIDTFHLSQDDVARRIGKSQSAVANKLRLLRLDEEVLTLLREGGCSERHARALLRLPDPDQQARAARQVVDRGLTVAQTEALVESMLSAPPRRKRGRPTLIVKDVRLFLNTITHSLDRMRSAGVDAQCSREDTDEAILLTIQIPRRASS